MTPDEHYRMAWACSILEYVRRERRWGLKEADVLRRLLTMPYPTWLAELEPDLRRWYGAPLAIPRDAWVEAGHDG